MADAGAAFDPDDYLAAVAGYYTTPAGEMLSLPYNSSTPVLWVNRDALTAAGIDPDGELATWQQVGEVLDELAAAGHECPLTTAWQSWVHLENLSAYHNVPFATQENGFAGLDTELAFNGPVQVRHIEAMGEWAKDGKFIYTGRRNARRAMSASRPRRSSSSTCGRCRTGKASRARPRTRSSAVPRSGCSRAMSRRTTRASPHC
jgi:sn-glycerol 3-phosphate transport system substrate-binding protein